MCVSEHVQVSMYVCELVSVCVCTTAFISDGP